MFFLVRVAVAIVSPHSNRHDNQDTKVSLFQSFLIPGSHLCLPFYGGPENHGSDFEGNTYGVAQHTLLGCKITKHFLQNLTIQTQVIYD